MPLIFSDDLKERIDEETLAHQSQSRQILGNLIVNENNFIKLKNKNNSTIISFKIRYDQLKKIHLQQTIAVSIINNVVYDKLRIKEIIKKDNYYICKLICKEKEIENNHDRA